MKATNDESGTFPFYSDDINKKEVLFRAISITVDLLLPSKVLISMKVKIHTINISNSTLNIVKFYTVFGNFQNKVAGLCPNNSINKNVK